jgi:DNA-binding MarR family transcriptional regulator
MTYQAPRMSATESRAWLSLMAVAELLPTALDSQLKSDAGLSHFEFVVCSVLKQAAQNTMRVKDLAASTNSTLPRLSKVVSRIEKRGLVERLADETDGRAINVQLTQQGRKILVRAMPTHIDYVRSLVLDCLTEEQLEQLAAALEPLVARLDPQRRLTYRRE